VYLCDVFLFATYVVK